MNNAVVIKNLEKSYKDFFIKGIDLQMQKKHPIDKREELHD